jgi:hypothetical protein
MEQPVADVLYVVLTLVFFGAMLGYTRACERLGDTREKTHER